MSDEGMTPISDDSVANIRRLATDKLQRGEPVTTSGTPWLTLLARLDAAERERDELRAAQGWRTIDSAPRDGTHILMHGEQNYHEGVRFGGAVTVSGYWDAIDEAWCSTGSTWTGPFYAPTHWQPLPPPPTRQPKRSPSMRED